MITRKQAQEIIAKKGSRRCWFKHAWVEVQSPLDELRMDRLAADLWVPLRNGGTVYEACTKCAATRTNKWSAF